MAENDVCGLMDEFLKQCEHFGDAAYGAPCRLLATKKNLNRDGGGDSVQWSQKDGGEKEEGEKEDEDDHSEELIFPRSPSFREYCIASFRSRNQSFRNNDSAFNIKNNGDEDSINKPEDVNKEQRRKKEE